MATYTDNLHLEKPAQSDLYNIGVFNGNADIIDSAMAARALAQNQATIEASSTASRNYAKGDFLVRNGLLYKVTSAIASGGTITPGTNCVATNTGAELKALNDSLANALEWKYLTSQTGSVAINLPTSWNELNIILQFPWNSIYGDSFYIQRAHMFGTYANNPYRYVHGHYNTASDTGSWSIATSNNQVQLITCIRNSTEQVANAILRVYYR